MDQLDQKIEESKASEVASITSETCDEEKPRRSIMKNMKTKLRNLEFAVNRQRSQRRLRRRGSAGARNAASLPPTPISPIPEGELRDWKSIGTTSLSEDCSSLTSQDDYLYMLEGEDDMIHMDDGDDNTAGIDLFAGLDGSKNGEMVHYVRGKSRGVKGTEQRVALFKEEEAPESFPEAMVIWLESVDSLVRSEELANVVGSSCHLVFSAGNLAVKTACLPLTIPLHLAFFTTDLLLGSCQHVAGALLGMEVKDDGDKSSDEANSNAIVERQQQPNPIQEIIGKVFGAPGFFLGMAGDMLGSAVTSVAAPVLGMQQQHHHPQLTAHEGGDHDLDRLRLDYAVLQNKSVEVNKNVQVVHSSKTVTVCSVSPSPPCAADTTGTTSSDMSMTLLRVDDLDVKLGKGPVPPHIFYIDLDPKHSNKQELSQSLQRLVSSGLSLMANHPTVRMGKKFEPVAEIDWHPEGSSKKLLRKMANMTSIERLKVLEKDHLIWSGEFKNKRQEGSFLSTDYTFFLARGIIRKSPREFLNLLWDNNRTGEYNNFCLGRNTVLDIDDKILSDPDVHEGTKVIESETRVPFTGKSVGMTCLMHVRPLERPDQGYVVISRSLDSGVAGTHVGSRDKVSTTGRKNEIIWGVNVIRRVPNNPQLTDLTSLSQVGSPLVPKFLAQRIGVMGVEDFYKNIRDSKTTKQKVHRSDTC
jgi:hypothetical protein